MIPRLPNEIWLKILTLNTPTPPELGELRGLSQQFREVADDNMLWQHWTLTAKPDQEPLRAAFIARTQRRTANGNRYLAGVYRGDLAPVEVQVARHVGGFAETFRAFKRGRLLDPIREERFMSYLLLESYGRDEDWDIAAAERAPASFWGSCSPAFRNDPAIVWRGVTRSGAVLPYVGSGLLTPGLLTVGLAQHGSSLLDMPWAVQHDRTYARIAIGSGDCIYPRLSSEMQLDRDLAVAHVKAHPSLPGPALDIFGGELEFYTPAYLRAMQCNWDFSTRVAPNMHSNETLLRRLAQVNPAALNWCLKLKERHDDAQFMQQVWRLAVSTDLAMVQAAMSPRLQARLGHIETAEFLIAEEAAPAVRVPTQSASWRRFLLN